MDTQDIQQSETTAPTPPLPSAPTPAPAPATPSAPTPPIPSPPTIYIPETQKPEMNFAGVDTAFALAMFVCGFLYWNLMLYSRMPGAGVTVFAAVILIVSYIYLLKSGFRQNVKSLTCLTLAGLSAVQFALFDNLLLGMLNFVFLTALFVYWICLSTGRRIDTVLSIYLIGDVIQQGLGIPFRNFGCAASAMARLPKKKNMQGILLAICGIVVFLPLLAMVVSLLVSADLAFEHFIREIVKSIRLNTIGSYIWQFVFGIPVALYLFGLIYGNVKGRYTDRISAKSVDGVAKAARIAPALTLYSALTSFNIIYLVFFAVQAVYLFSAFSSNPPGAFSYAEYARRGFFELCAIAGINLGVLVISHLLIQRNSDETPKILRIETVGIVSLTILLIATALSKMVMYINAYGLTPLRVYTSWFMILLLFIFVVVGVRQLVKFNASRIVIWGFVTLFLVLTYGNADGLIAKYNIDRYETRARVKFDIDAMASLSDGAVPHLYDLYTRTDKNDTKMREQLKLAILDRPMPEDASEIRNFREFNVQHHRADEIRNELRSKAE